MNGNDQLIKRALNNDLRDTTFVDTGIQVISDLVIFDLLFWIFRFACKPVAVPSTDDS